MRSRLFSHGSILMGMAMLIVVSGGPVSAQGGAGLGVRAFSPERDQKAELSKAALDAALDGYINESEAALDARMADLRSFFEERKGGSRRFAQSVLGIEGKLMVGGGVLSDLIDEISVAGGGARKPSALNKYVKDLFRKDVLDPAQAKQAVDEAVSGFLGDLAGSEARLLVKLKADLGDDQLALPRSLPTMEGIGREHYEATIRETVNGAVTDLGVSLAMFVASNIVSDKIVDKALPKDTSKGGRFIAGILTGIAVDMAVDKAAKEAGYDPEKALAAKTAVGIDRICQSIIDGDPTVLQFYPTLKVLRRMHPDEAVREACQRADEAVKRSANLGLREQLRNLRNDRHRRLWRVLTGHLVGPEAASSPFLMYTPLDAAKTSPAADIIRWADSITTIYGGTK